MQTNNFKTLEKELISNRVATPDQTKQAVNATTGIARMVGDMMDLFLPRMVNTLMGNPDLGKHKHYPNR